MEILYYQDKDLKNIPEEILDSLIEFIKEVWDPSMSRDKFFKKRNEDFEENPFMADGGSPLTLLVDGNKVVGHCISTPCLLWAEGKEFKMYWNSGLHLKDECRGKSLGIVLPQKLTEELPVVSGFFVVPQQLRTHEKLGFHIVGKIKEFIKILDPVGFIAKIDFAAIRQLPKPLIRILGPQKSRRRKFFAAVLGLIINVFYSIKSMGHQAEIDKKINFVQDFDQRLDALWDRVKKNIKFAQVRDSRYLNWQFKHDDGWEKVIVENGETIEAYAIIASKEVKGDDQLGGLRITSIIDILWDFEKTESLEQLIEFIEMTAKERKSDVLICSINHPVAVQRLKKSGFLKLPETVYFVIRSQNNKPALSPELNDWYMTRGDADAAGSLGPDVSGS